MDFNAIAMIDYAFKEFKGNAKERTSKFWDLREKLKSIDFPKDAKDNDVITILSKELISFEIIERALNLVTEYIIDQTAEHFVPPSAIALIEDLRLLQLYFANSVLEKTQIEVMAAVVNAYYWNCGLRGELIKNKKRIDSQKALKLRTPPPEVKIPSDERAALLLIKGEECSESYYRVALHDALDLLNKAKSSLKQLELKDSSDLVRNLNSKIERREIEITVMNQWLDIASSINLLRNFSGNQEVQPEKEENIKRVLTEWESLRKDLVLQSKDNPESGPAYLLGRLNEIIEIVLTYQSSSAPQNKFLDSVYVNLSLVSLGREALYRSSSSSSSSSQSSSTFVSLSGSKVCLVNQLGKIESEEPTQSSLTSKSFR